VAEILGEADPGGVNGQLIYSEVSDETTFTFATADVEEASTDQGWSNDAQTVGGLMADVETMY